MKNDNLGMPKYQKMVSPIIADFYPECKTKINLIKDYVVVSAETR